MSFEQKKWKDRMAEHINRRRLVKEDGTSELVKVERDEGAISQEGDAFNAQNMNDLEERISEALKPLDESKFLTAENFIISGTEDKATLTIDLDAVMADSELPIAEEASF